jgi:hypothetical protein
MDRRQQLQDFFVAYARRFNDFLSGGKIDIEGTLDSFAPFFIEASPLGVNGGQNDKNFKSGIEKGYAFYKSIGTKSMDIKNTDITILDDYHAMARIHWIAKYEKGIKIISIEFDVIYFVQTLHGHSKIFSYITGDEQKALQDAGVI